MVLYLNVICLLAIFIFALFELITLLALGFQEYYESHWNKIDSLNILVYVFYFYKRINHVENDLIPLLPSDMALDHESPFIQKK